jgi:hypothetical protein
MVLVPGRAFVVALSGFACLSFTVGIKLDLGDNGR